MMRSPRKSKKTRPGSAQKRKLGDGPSSSTKRKRSSSRTKEKKSITR